MIWLMQKVRPVVYIIEQDNITTCFWHAAILKMEMFHTLVSMTQHFSVLNTLYIGKLQSEDSVEAIEH